MNQDIIRLIFEAVIEADSLKKELRNIELGRYPRKLKKKNPNWKTVMVVKASFRAIYLMQVGYAIQTIIKELRNNLFSWQMPPNKPQLLLNEFNPLTNQAERVFAD